MPVAARVVPESTAMTNSQLSVINHRVQSKPLNAVRDNACTHWLAPHAPGTLRRGATPRLQFQVSSRQHAGTALWAAGVDSGRLISVVDTGRFPLRVRYARVAGPNSHPSKGIVTLTDRGRDR